MYAPHASKALWGPRWLIHSTKISQDWLMAVKVTNDEQSAKIG